MRSLSLILAYLLVAMASRADGTSSSTRFVRTSEGPPSMIDAMYHPFVEIPHGMYERGPQRLFREKPTNDRTLQFVSGARPYAPIRILFDSRPLESQRNSTNNATIDNILNTVLPAARERWQQHLSVRPAIGGVPVPADICGAVYAPLIGEDRREEGADLVIIVGGDLQGVCGNRTLAYATPCALNSIDRPNIGVINFCLNRPQTMSRTVQGQSLSDFVSVFTGATFRAKHLDVSLIDVTIHEIGHVLGLSSFMFMFFRDENGNPRTERDAFDRPVQRLQKCSNGTELFGSFPSNNTVKVVKLDDERYEQYMVTPRVKAIARNHFNCQELEGGRLEDNPEFCVGSHWHERSYFGELMSPVASPSSDNKLSLITMALFEDSGWYQVDYRGLNGTTFGLGAGCGFVEDTCIDKATNEPPSWNVNEFCSSPITLNPVGVGFTTETLNSVFCDPSYRSWTACDLFQYPNELNPIQNHLYFDDKRLSPLLFLRADQCPIPDFGLGLDCTIDDSYNVFYPGETVGKGSRCINAFHNSTNGLANRPACMRVSCDESARMVKILGPADVEYLCTYDGQQLEVLGKPGAYFVCPRLAAICPKIFSCQNGCFGRGKCVYPGEPLKPYCECFDGEETTDEFCTPSYVVGTTASVSPTSTAAESRSPDTAVLSRPSSPTLSPITPLFTNERPTDISPTIQSTSAPVAEKISLLPTITASRSIRSPTVTPASIAPRSSAQPESSSSSPTDLPTSAPLFLTLQSPSDPPTRIPAHSPLASDTKRPTTAPTLTPTLPFETTRAIPTGSTFLTSNAGIVAALTRPKKLLFTTILCTILVTW